MPGILCHTDQIRLFGELNDSNKPLTVFYLPDEVLVSLRSTPTIYPAGSMLIIDTHEPHLVTCANTKRTSCVVRGTVSVQTIDTFLSAVMFVRGPRVAAAVAGHLPSVGTGPPSVSGPRTGVGRGCNGHP